MHCITKFPLLVSLTHLIAVNTRAVQKDSPKKWREDNKHSHLLNLFS